MTVRREVQTRKNHQDPDIFYVSYSIGNNSEIDARVCIDRNSSSEKLLTIDRNGNGQWQRSIYILSCEIDAVYKPEVDLLIIVLGEVKHRFRFPTLKSIRKFAKAVGIDSGAGSSKDD